MAYIWLVEYELNPGSPSASPLVPRSPNGGADGIGGVDYVKPPAAAFVRRTHEAGAPFTSAVSPPVAARVDIRVSVAVLSKADKRPLAAGNRGRKIRAKLVWC
jgi:hypothetical protein